MPLLPNSTERLNLVLIGLVDTDDSTKGDTAHFWSLIGHLRNSMNVYSITLSQERQDSVEDYYLRFPDGKTTRARYWNSRCIQILKGINKTARIDLIYVRPTGYVFSMYAYALLHRIPYALELNGFVLDSAKGSAALPVIRTIYTQVFRRASLVIGAPGYMRYVKQLFNVESSRLLPVNLGYNGTRGNLDEAEARNRLNLNSTTNYLLFIGNIAPYQGLHVVLKCLADNLEKIRSLQLHLIVIGTGNAAEENMQFCEENDLHECVTFIPPQTKEVLKDYLSIGAVGLSPFVYMPGLEGMRSMLKTFDYMFHQMPVITTVMDELCDFVEEEGIGFVIKKYESEELMEMIEAAVTNRKKMVSRYDKVGPLLEANHSMSNRFGQIEERIMRIK